MIRNFILAILLILLQNIGNAQHDTTILVGTVPVDFRFPATGSCGTILVLPGWNFSKSNVCERSEFCAKAKESGYVLILPEMLKSVYSSETYNETRVEWKRYPTLRWITDTLIPYGRKHFHLFEPGDPNFLYGISTGARGVVLVAENTGNLFRAGAALSGDYDQTAMPDDKLMTGYYGSYENFKERWGGRNNPSFNSGKLKIPLFLAHGKKDAVVPCSQTTGFYHKISAENPGKGHVLQICDTCGHNYAFWNSRTKSVFDFFREADKRFLKKDKTH